MTPEERAWLAAAENHEGGRIPLKEFNPDSDDKQDKDDMLELCEAMEVKDLVAKKRFIAFIRRLRKSSVLVASQKVDQDTSRYKALRDFFPINLNDLTTRNQWIDNIYLLGWSIAPVADMYWRKCYSYILCSLVAGLEGAFKQMKEKKREGKAKVFTLTGTQGTGKSVLGAFLGLVLSQAKDGWFVNYSCGDIAHEFGPEESEKKVMIWDASSGFQPKHPAAGWFVVLVTSYNEKRWHTLGRQTGSSEDAGNYLYIDPASEAEVENMSKRPSRNNITSSKQVFDVVGGIPRICLGQTKKEATERIKKACDQFLELPRLVYLLDRLKTEEKVAGYDQIYPGLVAHFAPILPYRATYQLKMPSPFILDQLVNMVEEAEEASLRSTLKQLLQMDKARSFGGWIWEPFFAKKVGEGSVRFVGCSLPAKKESVQNIMEIDPNQTFSFQYSNLEELKEYLRQFMTGGGRRQRRKKAKMFAVGKAKKDNNAATGGVLVRREPFILVGLQLCVSRSKHPVLESGVIDLQDLSSEFAPAGKARTELWFVQPEECLHTGFDFVNLQALEFKIARPPFSESQGEPKKKKMKLARRAAKNAEPPEEKKLKSSNNPRYWNPKAHVTQRVVVAAFPSEGKGRKQGSEAIAKKMKEMVQKASSQRERGEEEVEMNEPRLRPLEATREAAKLLQQSYPNLFPTLLSDIDEDCGDVGEDSVDEEANQAPEDNNNGKGVRQG